MERPCPPIAASTDALINAGFQVRRQCEAQTEVSRHDYAPTPVKPAMAPQPERRPGLPSAASGS
jgi:hypothetical protein